MNKPDIDIDFANRTLVLEHAPATPARLATGRKHNTGVYYVDIPRALDGASTIEHKTAERLGYFKLDFLNVHVYEQVEDEQHLIELMREPKWELLQAREFFEQLIHVGKHYNSYLRMPEPIDSIPRMAMFLAVIRPAKRHLIGRQWHEVAQSVWDRAGEDSYSFKRSHSVAYAQLVAVHMNLLVEQLTKKQLTEIN